MSAIPVYTSEGEKSGDIDAPASLLVEGKNRQTLQTAVVIYQGNQRSGSASTKTRGEVAGSNKKPWKQKGTGRARAGRRQSPIWRGGGVAFGPRPRDYRKKLPRKEARLAFRQAFTDCVVQETIRVLETLSIAEPRTRWVVEILKNLHIEGHVLLVVDNIDPNLAMASRNLALLEVVEAKDLNVYQLVRYPNIVITRAALAAVEERVSTRQRGEE
jgi:large subunit ribosomal protein L4